MENRMTVREIWEKFKREDSCPPTFTARRHGEPGRLYTLVTLGSFNPPPKRVVELANPIPRTLHPATVLYDVEFCYISHNKTVVPNGC